MGLGCLLEKHARRSFSLLEEFPKNQFIFDRYDTIDNFVNFLFIFSLTRYGGGSNRSVLSRPF